MLGLLPIIAAGLGLERGAANELRSRLGVLQRKEVLPAALRAQVANVRAEHLQVVLQVFARDGLEITPGLRTQLFLAMVQVVQVGQTWKGRDSRRAIDWPSAALLSDYLTRYPLVESQWSWPLLLEGVRVWEMESAEALARTLEVQMVEIANASPDLLFLVRWLGRRISLGDPEPYPFLPTLLDWWQEARQHQWTEAQVMNLATSAMCDVAADHAGQAASPTQAWKDWGARVARWKAMGRCPMPGPVEMRFPGGWTLVRLVEPAQYRDESDLMDHCVGRSPHFETFYARHQAGSCAYFSLRDAAGFSRATFEVELRGTEWTSFRQAYGPRNTALDASLSPILTQIFSRSASMSDAFISMVRPEYPAFERVLSSPDLVVRWSRIHLKTRKARGDLLVRLDRAMSAADPRVALSWAVNHAAEPSVGVFSTLSTVPDLIPRYMQAFQLRLDSSDGAFMAAVRRSPMVAVTFLAARVQEDLQGERAYGVAIWTATASALLLHREAWLQNPSALVWALTTGKLLLFTDRLDEIPGWLRPFYEGLSGRSIGALRGSDAALSPVPTMSAGELVDLSEASLFELGGEARAAIARDPYAAWRLWFCGLRRSSILAILGEDPEEVMLRSGSAVFAMAVASGILTSWSEWDDVRLSRLDRALEILLYGPVDAPKTASGEAPSTGLVAPFVAALQGIPGLFNPTTRSLLHVSLLSGVAAIEGRVSSNLRAPRLDDHQPQEWPEVVSTRVWGFVARSWEGMGQAQRRGRLGAEWGSDYQTVDTLGRDLLTLWGVQQGLLRRTLAQKGTPAWAVQADERARKAMRRVLPQVVGTPVDKKLAQDIAFDGLLTGGTTLGTQIVFPTWEAELIRAMAESDRPSSWLAFAILQIQAPRTLQPAQRRILVRALASDSALAAKAVDEGRVRPSEIDAPDIRRRAGDLNQDISAALGLSVVHGTLSQTRITFMNAVESLQGSLRVLSHVGRDASRVPTLGPALAQYTQKATPPTWVASADLPAPPRPLQVAAQFDRQEESLTDAGRAWPCFWVGLPHDPGHGEALGLNPVRWASLLSSQAAREALELAFQALPRVSQAQVRRRHGGDPFGRGLALFVGCTARDVLGPHGSLCAVRVLPSATPMSMRVPMALPGGEQGWAVLFATNANGDLVFGRAGVAALATPLVLG